jgi:hypothetical protein
MSLEQAQLTRVKVDKTIFWKGIAHGRDQQINSYIIENGDLFLDRILMCALSVRGTLKFRAHSIATPKQAKEPI